MLSSLDAAYAFVRDTPRQRSRVEAHLKLSRAYFDLIFAWGYAQSGNEARSRELLEQARSALPLHDVAHQTLLRAFELRIRERANSPWTRLEVELPADTRARYCVTRLFEALAILSRVEEQNAIGHFWRISQEGGDPALREDLITQILVADGEGRVETVRELLEAAFASDWVNGAVLIGPCRRAGREAELLNALKRRPLPEVQIALEALGAEDPGLLQLEALEGVPTQKLQNARQHIGALAVSGRSAQAESLAAQAWALATDSFSTNDGFSLVALGVCETIVLSALRHELAPGNRSLLQPIAPSLAPPIAEREQGQPEGDDLLLLVRMLASNLRDVAELAGCFQDRFRSQHQRVCDFLAQQTGNSSNFPTSPLNVSLLARISAVREALDSVQGFLETEDEATAVQRAVSPLAEEVAALLEAFDNRDPQARVAFNKTVEAIKTIRGCLRSLVVERPAMVPAQLERIQVMRDGLLGLGERAECWVELPYDELLATIEQCLEDAERQVSLIPDDWDDDFRGRAREAVTSTRTVLAQFRA